MGCTGLIGVQADRIHRCTECYSGGHVHDHFTKTDDPMRRSMISMIDILSALSMGLAFLAVSEPLECSNPAIGRTDTHAECSFLRFISA